MTSSDDLKTVIRRNKLFGMWAAEKLGLAGTDADAYSNAIAASAVDPECSDVFDRVRRDFEASGVVQSDEQILCVLNELMLQAAKQIPASGVADAAAMMLVRKLMPR